MSENPRGRGRGRGNRGRGGTGGQGQKSYQGDRGAGEYVQGHRGMDNRGGGGRGGGGRGRGDRDGGGQGGRGGGRGGRGGGRGGVNGKIHYGIYKSNDDAHTPPEAVTLAEDQIVESYNGALIEQSYPRRPGYGTNGKPVDVWANYFEMKIPKELVLHRYDITKITLQVDGNSVEVQMTTKKKVEIIRELMRNLNKSHPKDAIVTDFGSFILSTKKFSEKPDNKEPSKKKPSKEKPGDEEPGNEEPGNEEPDKKKKSIYEMVKLYPNTTKPKPKTYKVEMGPSVDIHLSNLVEYLSSRDPSRDPSAALPDDTKNDIVQALNTLRNYHSQINTNYSTIGSHRVFEASNNDHVELGAGLMGMRGFFASVRLATARTLVNVNVSHAAFYKAGSLLDLIDDFSKGNGSLKKLEAFLKRLKVTLRGEPLGQRHRTIWGFATQDDGKELDKRPTVPKYAAGPDEVEFWYEKEGRLISVSEYMKEQHGISPQTDRPVINLGTLKNPSYFLPEMLDVAPGQIARTKLSPEQMADMIEFSARGPGLNAFDISEDGLKATGLDTSRGSSANTQLVNSGIKIVPKLISVSARVLKPPIVQYAQRTIEKTSWNLMNTRFRNPSNRRNRWSYVVVSMEEKKNIYNADDRGPLWALINNFNEELTKLGVNCERGTSLKPLFVTIKGNTEIRQMFESVKTTGTSLLLVILPNRVPADIYGSIKSAGDMTYGVATICINAKNLNEQKGRLQYINNMAMKFNLKFGGSNHFVDVNLNRDKTMIVGIDVTHPPPLSSDEVPSIAGMVASVDGKLGQWPAVIRRQAVARQEMVSELEEMLSTRLKLWLNKNGSYPENILVYRDGVSEGQYNTVIEKELPLLRSACGKLYRKGDRPPRISIIIVGKRHHTRFFPTDEDEATKDWHKNTMPGTVVDRGVTEACKWDFFLQAHHAIQGTARPIHYFVVHDEIFAELPSGTRANRLESVTHDLSYVFGRATNGVSVVTPAYYADIVCERARCYAANEFNGPAPPAGTSTQANTQVGITLHPNIVNTMYYI